MYHVEKIKYDFIQQLIMRIRDVYIEYKGIAKSYLNICNLN